MTHICVGKLTIIDSDNGLSPGRRQTIIWINAGILLIEPLGTNFNEILIGIQTFSFKKMHLKMASAKWRPFCLCLNVLNQHWLRWWLVVCLAYFQLDTYKHTTVKFKSKYNPLHSRKYFWKFKLYANWHPSVQTLTHLPLVPLICVSKLGQHRFK